MILNEEQYVILQAAMGSLQRNSHLSPNQSETVMEVLKTIDSAYTSGTDRITVGFSMPDVIDSITDLADEKDNDEWESLITFDAEYLCDMIHHSITREEKAKMLADMVDYFEAEPDKCFLEYLDNRLVTTEILTQMSNLLKKSLKAFVQTLVLEPVNESGKE